VRPQSSRSTSPWWCAAANRSGLPDAHALRQDSELQRPAAQPLDGQRVDPEDVHATAVGTAQPLEALDGGRLAGAVRTEQTEDLAAAHLERHAVDGDRRTVGLVQVLDGDDRFG
jgi:hypothetical protein